MYRGSDSVKIWFYPRNDEGVPEAIRQPGQCGQPILPDSTWGDPDANFPFSSQDCDYDQHFNAHQMVFDLTFCVSCPLSSFDSARLADIYVKGDWAGNVWSNSGCGAGTCNDCKTINFFPQALMSRLTHPSPPPQLSTTTQVHLLRLIGKSIACAFTRPANRIDRVQFYHVRLVRVSVLLPNHL